MSDLQKYVIQTLSYFHFFNYAPTFEEIYTFFPVNISKKSLEQETKKLLVSKKICVIARNPHQQGDEAILSGIASSRSLLGFAMTGGLKSSKYTPREYILSVKTAELKFQNSIQKIKIAQPFIRVLLVSPDKLIGLSGSVAMMNAKENDDIDLFIITAKNRMWTARIISLLFAQIMGLRRRRAQKNAKNKVCLNLFFDESNLKLPIHKQSVYGAHEVLQMKLLIHKDDTYQKFLSANTWVFKRFPNAKSLVIPRCHSEPRKVSFYSGILLAQRAIRMTGNFIERILKNFQLSIIRKHQTSEIITDTQLWFFPKDFEKKIKSLKL